MSSQNPAPSSTAPSRHGENTNQHASTQSVIPSKRPASEGPDYHSFLDSPQFTFHLGPDKTPFRVHSTLVESISAPLKALITNGHMEESCSGVAVLEDIEPGVFVAFCEFAYTGTYKTPSLRAGPGNKEADSNQPPLQTITISLSESVSNFYNAVTSDFQSTRYGAKPVAKVDSPDLTFHAKVYTFATRFLIEPLRKQCLSSLHRDLRATIGKYRFLEDFMNLVEYIYQHTGPAEPGGKSPLRNMITSYIAGDLPTYCKYSRFESVLENNKEFAQDLIFHLGVETRPVGR